MWHVKGNWRVCYDRNKIPRCVQNRTLGFWYEVQSSGPNCCHLHETICICLPEENLNSIASPVGRPVWMGDITWSPTPRWRARENQKLSRVRNSPPPKQPPQWSSNAKWSAVKCCVEATLNRFSVACLSVVRHAQTDACIYTHLHTKRQTCNNSND